MPKSLACAEVRANHFVHGQERMWLMARPKKDDKKRLNFPPTWTHTKHNGSNYPDCLLMFSLNCTPLLQTTWVNWEQEIGFLSIVRHTEVAFRGFMFQATLLGAKRLRT